MIQNNSYDADTLHEECGVFGMYDFDGADVASTIYYGLFALQHRGQESCGIAVSYTSGPKGKVLSYKGMGLVNEVFAPENLEQVIANNAKDLYGALLVTGIMSHIAIQVVLNIAVVTNTIPNTGVILPFISYGGTSLVFLMAEMGLALSVSKGIRLDTIE